MSILKNDNKLLKFNGKFFNYVLPPPPPTYKVNLLSSQNGTITADNLSGLEGTLVTLSNTPNAHYSFGYYSLTGANLSGNQFYILDEDVSAKGTFIEDPKYTLTLQQSTGGTITANKLTGYTNESATLSYTLNTDYYFTGWNTTGAIIQNNKVPFTQNTTAKGGFKWTSANTGAKTRGDYTANKCGYGDRYRHSHISYYNGGWTEHWYDDEIYKNDTNIDHSTSSKPGNIYAFKGFMKKTNTTTANRRCGFTYNSIGYGFATLSANYVPILSSISNVRYFKVTYSSNKIIASNFNRFVIKENNWYTAGKEFAYVVSSNNNVSAVTAYYNGEKLLQISSNNSYDSNHTYPRFGIFSGYTTTSYSFPDAHEYQYFSSYVPENGSCGFHLRSFPNINAATAWASTTGLI